MSRMPTRYRNFTESLVSSLTADSRVLGIVALGSMAEVRGRVPDVWSDHDFFVITNEPEAFREVPDWLPERGRIALWFRETAHGCKALYDDGHLIEYAVFTPDELKVARANDYRVLLDRERIEQRMAELVTRLAPPPGREWLHGMFLGNLVVAAGRSRRGEWASARWTIAHALKLLVQLLGGGPDDLDPLRRFAHPELERAMRLDPFEAAAVMLAIYEREAQGEPRAIAAVRAALV